MNPSDNADDYYVELNGNTAGPYTLHQLRAMWGSGTIHSHTLFCCPGMSEWFPLSTIQTELEPSLQHDHVPAPPVPPARKLVDFAAKFLVASVILIVVITAIGLMSSGGNRATPAANDLKFDAYYTAKTIVLSDLKSPGTAKFSEFHESVVEVKGDEYQVGGWVDAQNSFGALLRKRFICQLRYDAAAGKWTHLKTGMLE